MAGTSVGGEVGPLFQKLFAQPVGTAIRSEAMLLAERNCRCGCATGGEGRVGRAGNRCIARGKKSPSALRLETSAGAGEKLVGVSEGEAAADVGTAKPLSSVVNGSEFKRARCCEKLVKLESREFEAEAERSLVRRARPGCC